MTLRSSINTGQVGALAVDGRDQQIEMISRGELASRPDRSARRACRVPTCPGAVKLASGAVQRRWPKKRTAPITNRRVDVTSYEIAESMRCAKGIDVRLQRNNRAGSSGAGTLLRHTLFASRLAKRTGKVHNDPR